jgi:hypothetical protein
MHLLLGTSTDVCCVRVSAALAAEGCQARLVSNPLSHSPRFSWWLDTWNSSTNLDWDGKQPTDDGEIESVLVRNLGCIDPDGWQAGDLAYIHAETQAGLLRWLGACIVQSSTVTLLQYGIVHKRLSHFGNRY